MRAVHYYGERAVMHHQAERYINRRVAYTYRFLLECSEKFAQARVPQFVDAPKDLLEDPNFSESWMRYWSDRLRCFFSGESGQRAAVILGLARHTIVTGKSEDDQEYTEYGVGPHGPYKKTMFKKQHFYSRQRTEMRIISFEELCYFSSDTMAGYWAVYRLINMTIDEMRGGKDLKTKQ